MLEALLWSAATGLAARVFLSGSKPGLLVTMLAGLGGCVLGFVVGHELLRIREFHLFEPDTLIPAITASVIILLLIRRSMHLSQRGWLFR